MGIRRLSNITGVALEIKPLYKGFITKPGQWSTSVVQALGKLRQESSKYEVIQGHTATRTLLQNKNQMGRIELRGGPAACLGCARPRVQTPVKDKEAGKGRERRQ